MDSMIDLATDYSLNDHPPRPYWFHLGGFDMKPLRKGLKERELKQSNGACHAYLFKNRSGDYDMQTSAFLNGPHFCSDLKRPMHGNMLPTAYALARDFNETDDAYAKNFGGDVGKPGIFLRKGPYLILGGVGNGLDTDPFPCVFLHDYIWKDAERLRSCIVTDVALPRTGVHTVI